MVDLDQSNPPDKNESAAVAAAIEGLLRTHEARVLATMGLFIGYICVFFTKIMSFTDLSVGAMAVAVITLLLLFLDRDIDFRSRAWWLRSIVVIVLTLILTAPQLYFAWTVSVTEAEAAARAVHERKVQQTKSQSNITNTKQPGADSQ
jgi:predicted Co/Zn/Cd cation transporter (cation efflux family)